MDTFTEEISAKYLDFKIICRICLQSSKQIYDIYTSFDVKRSILYCDMLSRCTKLTINTKDDLPHNICKECIRQLKRTYTFNLQCEASEKKLRCLLRNFKDENSRNNQSVKAEVADVKTEENGDAGVIEKLLPVLEPDSKEINKDIKVEYPYEMNAETENSWDADDDNCFLINIKPRLGEKNCVRSENYEGISQKKKRGRKKKECLYEIDVTDSEWVKGKDNCLEEITPRNHEKGCDDPDSLEDIIKEKKKDRKKRVLVDNEFSIVRKSKLPHQCDICGKFLSNKSNLKAHKISHTNLRPYKCTDCPATFRGHSALFQHRRSHSGETPYHCEYCPKQFGRRTNLINHIRIHTGEKLHSCEICFKTFVQSAQLSIHMKRHSGEKPYLCQVCGKGFPIVADLKVHQRTHNGEKPYSCHLCSKTFATAGNLSIHVRIHNKEIRYNCKECTRGFVTCSAFNVHMKRHKGQKDYHCECGKTFYTSSALKQHKVVHTGEKKYQCKICDRKFTQASHLTRHFKKDHLKPNAPVPSAEKYRLVIKDNSKTQWTNGILANDIIVNIKENGSGVKSEVL